MTDIAWQGVKWFSLLKIFVGQGFGRIGLKGSAGGHVPLPDSVTSSGVQGHALPGNV